MLNLSLLLTKYYNKKVIILIEALDCRVGAVIEVKYAEDGNLNRTCEAALAQIEEQSYDAKLQEDGMRSILKYGIACFKKGCKVMTQKL